MRKQYDVNRIAPGDMKPIVTILTMFLLSAVLGNTRLYAQDVEHLDLKKPVQLSGNLSLTLQSYHADGIDNRQQPFTWLLTGTPTLTVLGVQIPFSFLLSNFENRYYQPFNQFGVSPYYKWVRIHLGYRNVQFSPYTLAGYRMLGAGVELTPRGFRFGFMYGRLNRSTEVDSAQNANPLAYRPLPTYTRMAYAVKVGVGNERNYFDISYLKGWDKESSLPKQAADTVGPQENTVIGFSWNKIFFKHLIWHTDIGLSAYTLDTHADAAVDNDNDPLTKKVLGDLLHARTSTQYLSAGETRLTLQEKKYSIGISYKRIDPDYKSMGAYFFQSDIEQYTFIPTLKLDSGRLFFTGSVGMQHDNLNGMKLATSKRFIGNANLSYNPSPRFGFNANYSNYGITQNPTRISPTSELFKQVSQNFVVMPYMNLTGDLGANNIQVLGSYQLLHSPVQSINTAPDQHTLLGSLVYGHTWLSKSISANVSFNYNNTTLPQGNIGAYGGGIGASVPLFKQRASLTANAIYDNNFFNSQQNGYTLNTTMGITVPFLKHHTIQADGSYLKNEAKDQTVVQSFDEIIFRIAYGFTF